LRSSLRRAFFDPARTRREWPRRTAVPFRRVPAGANAGETNGETQVFIETPYRNEAMLKEILATCRATTRLAIAADLTSPAESVVMDTVAGWKKRAATIGKRPAIFLLLA
jgi:16S rRNA (cytidine1402-2'-O)-methyltransferase